MTPEEITEKIVEDTPMGDWVDYVRRTLPGLIKQAVAEERERCHDLAYHFFKIGEHVPCGHQIALAIRLEARAASSGD